MEEQKKEWMRNCKYDDQMKQCDRQLNECDRKLKKYKKQFKKAMVN
jgi:hypothetical protein